MSDFLLRLAQRQLGTIATIEPRSSGLYAPVAGETAPREPGLGSDHQTAAEVGRKNFSTSGESSVWAPPQYPAVSPESSTGVPPTGQRWPILENAQRTEYPLRNAAQSGAENTPLTNDRQFSAEVPPLVPAKLSAARHSMDGTPEPQRTLAIIESSPLERRRSVAEGKTAFSVQSLLVARKESDGIARRQPLYGLKEPALIPRRPTPLQAHTTDSAAPPVHVTIGRIEVTALTAPAPPKRALQPRKQGMSLDDYLARRKGRER